MASSELENFILESLEKKIPEDDLKERLKNMGWSEEDITSAFEKIKHKNSLKRKRAVIGIITFSFLIAGIILIMFFSPRSPTNKERIVDVELVGAAETTSLPAGEQLSRETTAIDEISDDPNIPQDQKDLLIAQLGGQ